ncbi:MAG: pseudouridine synthase [Cetobacterium sp.]|uniref:pseudouridine synthase n=1 Tax=unclassified Cetobacterium TaxID=2630983 RepID=UPI00163C9CE3|nr:pseudouridine synthase [Cetobacterium sp. 2A]MBC2856049.1 rRNA pseudouridine synthase [Cetobacterium sp. 2A]
MRLEKYLVECGVGSRKVIKKEILDGKVKVNGEIILDERIDVYPETDIITFEDKELKYKEMKYYVLYKIAGYITAMKDERKKTVVDLLPEWMDTRSIFPIGRLDRDTEGVLLFTNDGALNYSMTHPDEKFEKVYYVELNREISEESIKRLEDGIIIDDRYQCLPAKVEYLNPKAIHLTITEGKYHQVKKMLKAVGNRVDYLKRVKFGNIELGDMEPGEIRELKLEEII